MKREIKLKLRSFLLKPYLLKALILVAFLIRSILSGGVNIKPKTEGRQSDKTEITDLFTPEMSQMHNYSLLQMERNKTKLRVFPSTHTFLIWR